MWTEHTLNPKLISSIFKGNAPSLENIRMYEISVIFGGSLQCRIHFDLQYFLTDAPKRWIQNKYDTVGMSLCLIDAEIKQFSIYSGIITGNLSIKFIDSNFLIEFKTDKSELIFSAISKWINVDKLEGYISNKIH